MDGFEDKYENTRPALFMFFKLGECSGRFVKQKSVLVLCLASLSLISTLIISTISIVAAQQQYEFVTKWGSEGSGPGQFNGQNDVDPFKNFVYVADYDNNRIQVFDSDGTFVTSWGTEGEEDGQRKYLPSRPI
jgi:hypothetical protein